MDARSERAPRECLILGSAQTLVGPVSVFGPMFGQCVRILPSCSLSRRPCLFYQAEPLNMYAMRLSGTSLYASAVIGIRHSSGYW